MSAPHAVIQRAVEAEARLANIARTRRPTAAETAEANDAYHAAAVLRDTAPDMAEALAACVLQYEAFVEQVCKGEDNRFHEKKIAKARAALKKAGVLS